MADQCIVCLENLDAQPLAAAPQLLPVNLQSGGSPATSEPAAPSEAETVAVQPPPKTLTDILALDDDNKIAEIQVCGHVLHDSCLREWSGKANSCPICRQTFHLVHVHDRIGGTKLSSYTVEDKKQVAEFDAQAWLDENPEEDEPARPCPICENSDHEEVLLLCDSCDAPYHTYCVGLDSVPRGHWFCLECSEDAAELLAAELEDPEAAAYGLAGSSDRRSDYLPRTQATMRRARNRARSDEWQGAWGQIAGRVFDALNLDLDNHDDDEVLQNYRRSQQRRERERTEYQRWQQRLNIASRLGAHDVFAHNLPRVLPQPIQQAPPPPQETPEEKKAWGALEKAMEASSSNGPTSNSRKRKSRSVTASPREPSQEPERKLKRPRTRRVPHQSEASSSTAGQPQPNGSSSSSTPAAQNGSATNTASRNVVVQNDVTQNPAAQNGAQPSFLSTLLKEVETIPSSDDEIARAIFTNPRSTVEASSPVTSPSPSGYSSPRALSTTPPPRNFNERPGSPLSLMSRIEPIYPPANFSPNRKGGDHSDSESRSRQHIGVRSPEIRQPRPRRQQPVSINTEHMSRSPDSSPTRASLSLETKESINAIIKAALKPHYKSGNITSEQYTTINRDLSRKLYRDVPEEALIGDARHRYEKIASKEVARAVADVKNVQI